MKLKNKFLVIFLLISTIPIIIITSYTYDRYTRLVEKQTTQISDSVFEKAIQEANTTISNLKHISEIFNFYSASLDSIIDDIKKYKSKDSKFSTYDVFKSNQNIQYICQNLIFSFDYINGIYIFTPAGPVLGYGFGNNSDIRADYNPTDDEWYQKTLAKDGQFYIDGISEKDFILNSGNSISFSQALYDVFTHEFLGVLFIDTKPSVFDLSNINTLPDTAMLAVENSTGSILYSNIDSMKTTLTPGNTRTQTADLDIEGLKLIFALNYEELYQEFGVTRTMILAIAIICAIVFLIISILVSHYITKPITFLSQKMSVRNGTNLVTTEKYLNRSDEIGILYNEYNHMMETLSEYIEKELQNKLITLDSQMKSLEAQINSHFLYNTLESINSIAEIEEVESISTMSLALGSMFRYSIKTKSELVSIADELKHVQDYTSIQQIRFDNRFLLLVNISPDMYSLKVLKLILQPIVENALYHGLQYCNCGSRITLDGRVENQCIYLTITDDGQGMSPEQLAVIEATLKEKAQFTELGHRNKQSIGIKNIHSRIELYYGEGYGLSIKSLQNQGTSITIKLPSLEDKWR